jgi:hypothetical protein
MKSERFQHFNYFLSMIAGAGEMPELGVAVDMMVEMPLHNYHDLPRAALEPWCAFFEACAGPEKTRVFEEIWGLLSSPEQTAVIADLRLFLGMQMQAQQQQGEQQQGEEEQGEEDGDGEAPGVVPR